MSLPRTTLAEADEPIEPSDVELIAAVRAGDGEAYGRLYERHLASARHLARQLTRSPAEVDDLTSEAFAKVLDTLRSGGGPTTAFRAYLLTTLRNTLYDRVRRDRRLELSDDMTRHDPGVPWVDTVVAGLESTLAARAFARLPERWQTVLWHTEVEQESPAQLAPMLGMTPNGVAALAYRAREGLRQAYLREHLSEVAGERCRWTVERLGAWARDGLSKREQARVDEHLAGCDRCRPLAAELEDVNGGLRGLIAPVVLGSAAAAAYLSSSAPEAAAAAGGAAGAAGAGAGAATAGAGTAAGAGVGAAGAGAAGAGAAAVGAVAAEVGVASTTVAGGGGALSTFASWVIGTHAGQAVAAAVTAVVVGGTAVGVGVSQRAPDSRRAAGPVASAPATTGVTGTDLPASTEAPGGPGAAEVPGGSGAPSGSQPPGSPDPSAGAAPSGRPGTPGRPSGLPAPPGGGTGRPSVPPAPPAGPTALAVGTPAPVRPLRQGKAGEIGIAVRNDGGGAATNLVATVTLPPGITVRAGGSDTPGEWRCTGTGSIATCRVSSLAAGASGTVRVKVRVGATAVDGTVSGQLVADGGLDEQIPLGALTVLPR